MISLKNVSKFYYKKGMIASGISRVNLNLDLGEFVVITGESGSGKSTLLNVISGIDTYEEGEMYIDGRETSHFSQKDFAEYRKRYIGNIFQSFNLINSYTVYQNVELVLRINGYRRKYIQKRVKEILAKVGLLEHAHTKASKLSGGQKQRVAIARALAKETEIIVADEPTGNLDSESASDIVKLLSEIAKDKLVIVVTHNYEQFGEFATRKIKMHDGKIAEDIRLERTSAYNEEALNDIEKNKEQEETGKGAKRSRKVHTGKLSAASKLRLGLRNAFNVVPKFLLLLVVFTFLITAVTSQYTSYLSQQEEAEKMGVNSYFNNLRLDRIVLKKADGSKFTTGDYDAISSIYNIKGIAEYDVLLDNPMYLEDDDFNYIAVPESIDNFEYSLLDGRMPEADDEILLAADRDEYFFRGNLRQRNLDRTYDVELGYLGSTMKVKVVGIAYRDDPDDNESALADYSQAFMTAEAMDKILAEIYHDNSQLNVDIGGKIQLVEAGDSTYNLIRSDKVKKGEAIVSAELDGFFKDENCVGKEIKVKADNIYISKSLNFTVKDKYSEKNYKTLLGRDDYEEKDGAIFISDHDYYDIFAADNYQATVYVNDTDQLKETKKALQETGYTALPLRETLVPILSDALQMIQLPITVLVIAALFFIAYFVIRLILRSRSGYFSILRMLGMSRKAIRRIMDIELITVMTISFAIFMGFAMLSTYKVISIDYVDQLVKYIKPAGYAILYGIMFIMSYLISGKFSKSLFKKSAMGAYREEA